MPTLKQRIQFALEGGRVVRYHTRPGIKPDTDAQHSHGVAMLCYFLTGNPSANLLMAALTHDLAEQVVSDVSAHTKRELKLSDALNKIEIDILVRNGFLFELNDYEQKILNLADKMEILLYCCYERSLGNKNVRLIWERQSAALEVLGMDNNCREVFYAIHQIWKEINLGIQFECLTQ